MASTYPLEVIEADRWVNANKNLKGDALTAAVKQQSWDDSVKSLVATPDVLDMMSTKLDWTQALGNAVLAQQPDVMDAIQRLRAKAQANNKLASNQQQTVATQQQDGKQVIVIAPTQPDTLYVPYYDPSVVYGPWPYPAYPPYYWPAPGYIAAGIIATGIAFGAGYALGRWASGGYWGGGVNWGSNNININRNININNVNRGNGGNWAHNPAHRQGVRYPNANVAAKFGNGNLANGAQNRMDFRGRSGNQVLNPGAGAPAESSAAPAAATIGAESADGGGSNRPNAGGGGNRPNAGNNARRDVGNRANVGGGGGGPGNALGNISSGRATPMSTPAVAAPVWRRRWRPRRGRWRRRCAAAVVAAVGGGGGGGGGGGRGGGGGGGRRSDFGSSTTSSIWASSTTASASTALSITAAARLTSAFWRRKCKRSCPMRSRAGADGYLRVYYDKLGLKFETYDAWLASGAQVPAIRSRVRAGATMNFAEDVMITKHSIRNSRRTPLRLLASLVAAIAVFATASAAFAQEDYKTPQDAVDALVATARSGDQKAALDVLGPDGQDIISSGDKVSDDAIRARFVASYDTKHQVAMSDEDKRATLIIGDNDYPFPIPIIRNKNGSWSFDTAAGREEILYRRIGHNELDAIQTCLAYVDAQDDYAAKDRGAGVGVYAQRFISTDGKTDGLYWPAASGQEESPLGSLFATASAQGYHAGEWTLAVSRLLLQNPHPAGSRRRWRRGRLYRQWQDDRRLRDGRLSGGIS